MKCKQILKAGSSRQCQLDDGHDDACTHSGIARDVYGRDCGNYTYTWSK